MGAPRLDQIGLWSQHEAVMMWSEEQLRKWPTVRYKIEYPFHAVDSTIYHTLETHKKTIEATEVIRRQITTGSVHYSIIFPEFHVSLMLNALDNRLCALIAAVAPVRSEHYQDVPELEIREYLNGVIDEIVETHEALIAATEESEVLLSPKRSRGGRVTWPEDAEAITRLQSSEDRELVKQDWKRRVIRNRKRKLKDPDNRFRQLVQVANNG
jgi:hypothetical protein